MDRERVVLAACMAAIFFLGFFSILDKSMTWDERCYIGAGKYIIESGNLKYNILAYHPPLSFYINSIFLMPLELDKKAYEKDDCWEFGNSLVYHSGYNPKIVLALARLPFIIMSMILALFVFRLAKGIYGVKSGYLALLLYTFSTAVISQSNLAMTDFPVTFFIFLSVYFFWRYSNSESVMHFAAFSVFFGLALLSKLTGLVLAPVLAILLAYHAYTKHGKFIKSIAWFLKMFFAMSLIAFFILFAGYGFQFGTIKSVMPDHYIDRAYEEFGTIGNENARQIALYAFEKIRVPVPSYFFGFGGVSYHSREGQGSFINGIITDKSSWYFPLAVFFYKTQMSLIVLVLLSFLLYRKTRPKFSGEAVLLLPMALITILFVLNNITAGVRHILPIYPFLFVFSSKLLKIKSKIIWYAVIILMVHYAISGILIFPNYLAYFNEFAGASNGYKHLVGANLDQGQDLPGLRKFMEVNGISKINLSYFGSIDPNEYVGYEYMPSPYFQHWVPDFKRYAKVSERKEDCRERKGIVAISATNLQNVHLINKTCFDWLKKYEPTAKIGYSIFVYNITNG